MAFNVQGRKIIFKKSRNDKIKEMLLEKVAYFCSFYCDKL